MALLQNDKAIFYHPLDDSTESLQSQAWTGTSSFAAAKISSGLNAPPSTTVDSFGTATDFRTGGGFRTRIAALSPTKFVVAWRSSSVNTGNARVGTVSGTDITYGAEVEWFSIEQSWISLTAISATKVVIAYHAWTPDQGAAKVGTVSGTDITFGAAVAFNSGSTPKGSVGKLDSSKVIVTYALATSSGSAKVGTVSGTDITFGAATQFRSGNTGPNEIAFISSTTFVVFYREIAVNGDGFARLGTVSGTDITFGTEAAVALEVGDDREIDAVGLTTTKFVVVYKRPGGPPQEGAAKVGTISGTDLTFGAQALWSNSATSPRFCTASKISSSQFVISYRDTSNRGQAKIGTVSGTDVTFGAATEYNSNTAEGNSYNDAAVLDSTSLVAGYFTGSTGTTKIGTLSAAGAALTAPTPGAYSTAATATKVAFCGWLKNPSA